MWKLVIASFFVSAAAWAGPKASSELEDSEGVRHPASMAFDGLLQTGWAEGDVGPGDAAWLELSLARSTELKSISVWPGNLSQGSRSLREYGRPASLTITLYHGSKEVTSDSIRVPDGSEEGPQRIDVPLVGTGNRLRITMDKAYEGYVFNDTYIAEVALNFAEGDNPSAVERLSKWQESSDAKRSSDRNNSQIDELVATIEAEEFGDSESLKEIMDRAGDGAPYLRHKVRTLVGDGYRVQALTPDQYAIDQLLKLRDPNAIPALEMASTRVTGKRERRLQAQVDVYYALQELIGGGDPNVPNWGQSGWEVGALRSFGEPMSVEVDQFGEVYVGDLGNHRVQRFDTQGSVKKHWSGDPEITDAWFSKTRRHYVGGSPPKDEPGYFVNPVDIVVIPGKDADGFAALDAKGRVQVFNEEGHVAIGWEVRTDDEISPGVGGEGYLLHVKGKLVVIWGNDVFVYGLNSEELRTWKIEDGVPNGAEALKNGKLVLIFGNELIQYSIDGFRHGTVLGEELGQGFEDWDVTVDAKGKLWAVIDTGWLFKYKKPGKIDYKLQISEVDLLRPRLAVFDDVAFIVERDRILRIDALEMKAQRELEEEAAAEEAEETD